MEMTSAKSARQCVARHSLSTNFPGKRLGEKVLAPRFLRAALTFFRIESFGRTKLERHQRKTADQIDSAYLRFSTHYFDEIIWTNNYSVID